MSMIRRQKFQIPDDVVVASTPPRRFQLLQLPFLMEHASSLHPLRLVQSML